MEEKENEEDEDYPFPFFSFFFLSLGDVVYRWEKIIPLSSSSSSSSKYFNFFIKKVWKSDQSLKKKEKELPWNFLGKKLLSLIDKEETKSRRRESGREMKKYIFHSLFLLSTLWASFVIEKKRIFISFSISTKWRNIPIRILNVKWSNFEKKKKICI